MTKALQITVLAAMCGLPSTTHAYSAGTLSQRPSTKFPWAFSRPATPKSDTTKVGNLVVPSVGTGTISWSSSSLITLQNLEVDAIVDEACRSDAAFFDTAERYGSHLKTAVGMGYGETEKLLRKSLDLAEATKLEDAGGKGTHGFSAPVVATKFTPSPWRQTVDSVVDACDQSRRRLGVEQIDLYQLHMPDVVQPLRNFGVESSKDDVYWRGLAECHRLGLVKNVGVSNYGPTLLEECQETLAGHGVPLASNQIAYSLIGRHNGAQETVDKCRELGVAVLACYPFAMGLLTGKYSSENLTPLHNEGDGGNGAMIASLSASKKSSLELKDIRSYAAKIGPLVRAMEDIARDRRKTVAQVALNYVMCKGAIPIPGSNTVEQLRDNIGAMGWRLTPREVVRLESEADVLGCEFDGAGFKRTGGKFVGYGVEKWILN